jgi:hypothetical protein
MVWLYECQHCELALHMSVANMPAPVQPELLLQASKCGSLLHLLRSSGPTVVSSSFSAILDVCALLLKHDGIAVARLNSGCRLDDCLAVSSTFSSGQVQVVLIQQQVALKFPMLDLSRADLCVFYDSGLSRKVCGFRLRMAFKAGQRGLRYAAPVVMVPCMHHGCACIRLTRLRSAG